MDDLQYYVVRGATIGACAFVMYKWSTNYQEYYDIFIPSFSNTFNHSHVSNFIDYRNDIGLRLNPTNEVEPVTYNIEKDLQTLKKLYPKQFAQLMKRDNISTIFEKNFDQNYIDNNSFKIMQFNMLADGLSGAYWPGGMADAKAFVGIDKECLEWRYRGLRIIEEIVRSGADIICLQECDRVKFFDKYLSKLGFSYVYQAKDGSPASKKVMPKLNRMREQARKMAFLTNQGQIIEDISKVDDIDCDYKDNDNDIELYDDGIAIFYNNKKFKILNSDNNNSSNIQYISYKNDNKLSITAVGLPLTQINNNKSFLLVSTHLKSTKTYEGELIRCQQINKLFEKNKIVNGTIKYDMPLIHNELHLPILLCLDMNGTHKESHDNKNNKYDALCYNRLTKEHKFISLFKDAKTKENELTDNNNNKNRRGNRGCEPEYTTFKKRKDGTVKHTIDYIFEHCGKDIECTNNMNNNDDTDNDNDNDNNDGIWSVTQYWEIPETDKVIPDWFYPSDHFSLCLQLTWNDNNDKNKKKL